MPTLVLYKTGVKGDAELAASVADRIPGAKTVGVPGKEGVVWVEDPEKYVAEMERFLGSVRREEAELERVLSTVLFTDIVGSTEAAAKLGDRAWRDLLERHNATVRALLARYRGREVDTAGDGFFATFDGPARAVHCALAISVAVGRLGLEVRVGIHAGEVEMIDDKVGGIAVSIGARIGGLARPSEVLVSQTVKDIVAGSGLAFRDREVHQLKGVPGEWRLYAVLNNDGT